MDDRVIVSREPLNAETRFERHAGPLTPEGLHYARSHFAQPGDRGAVSVGGAVARPRAFDLAAIRALPAHTLTVTLECAGNGRAFLSPPTPGEQWRLGAVSTASWTGSPLRALLEPAGLDSGTVELLFRGADRGTPPDLGSEIAFERSLPLGRALADDVLVAYAMNGGPIPAEHGAPLRLVVPTWYGMASVKWLREIVALREPFRGFYQAARYVIEGEPLGEMHPRAVILPPGPLRAGAAVTVRGYAWSGAPIERVRCSTDAGTSWTDATLGPSSGPAAWREWSLAWVPPAGTHTLLACATDARGETQPLEQRWNALGYANNAAQPERVEAR